MKRRREMLVGLLVPHRFVQQHLVLMVIIRLKVS